MTNGELKTICKQLTIRVEQLEKELKEGISNDPNYFYLKRMADALEGLPSNQKNSLTRRMVLEAARLKPFKTDREVIEALMSGLKKPDK